MIMDDRQYMSIGQVQDQFHIPLAAKADQLLQVLQGAEPGIDGIVIRHVILVIGRGKEYRSQPDSFNSQAFSGGRIPVVQVIHPVDNSAEISDPVSVGIRKGSDENLIKNATVVFRLQPCPFRKGKGTYQNQRQQKQCKPFHDIPFFPQRSSVSCTKASRLSSIRKDAILQKKQKEPAPNRSAEKRWSCFGHRIWFRDPKTEPGEIPGSWPRQRQAC